MSFMTSDDLKYLPILNQWKWIGWYYQNNIIFVLQFANCNILPMSFMTGNDSIYLPIIELVEMDNFCKIFLFLTDVVISDGIDTDM